MVRYFGPLFALSLLAATGCSVATEEVESTSAAELGTCSGTTAIVAATAGLWLRGAPSPDAPTVYPTPMPHGVRVVLHGPRENGFAKISYPSPAGELTGWASTQWLECGASGGGEPEDSSACGEGKARHAYARGASVTVTLDDGSSYAVPYGQKLLVDEAVPGPTLAVRVPTFDPSGTTAELRGHVDAGTVKVATSCIDSGILQRARTGATKLLGQYDFDRGPWGGGTPNQRNAVLGLNRVDGAVVGTTTPFVYLDRIADDRTGALACGSDADCDGGLVCHQRGVCGPYYYGVSTSGTELWASGVCGTATNVHRAALDAALVPLAYTTHGRWFPSNQFPGADAEVYWSSAGPPAQGQHYKFANDTAGDLVLVGGARVVDGNFVTSVQIWGTVDDGRYSEYTIAQGGANAASMTYTVTRPTAASMRVSPETGTIQRVATSGESETWRIGSSYWRDAQVSVPATAFKSRNHPAH